MRDELDEFSSCVSGLPFRQIGRNGYGCSAHLGDEAKFFFRWISSCQSINDFGELNSFWPNEKVFITAGVCLHIERCIATLVTRHPSLLTSLLLPGRK